MFRDRDDAAGKLAAELAGFQGREDVVVLGVPRGGLVVASRIARWLGLPLDAVFVKKLGHPLSSEYAIGVVTPDSARLSPDAGDVPRDYLEGETRRLRALLEDRRRSYAEEAPPLPLEGKTALIVDDGAATGLTVLAAVDAARARGAAKVVVALPVAGKEAARDLAAEADELVCLSIPELFYAIGESYEDFDQVDDAEALAALILGRSGRGASRGGPRRRA